MDIGFKPISGAVVKSYGIERLLKSRLELGEVSVIEMNESKSPL